MQKLIEKLKKTPLYQDHINANAKMVSFGGWDMPIQYGSIIDEHMTVRNKVGLFDVSHMGEFFVSGGDSLNLLQKLVPQDISKLTEGKAIYCQLTNEDAGIIDDLIIYKLENKDNNHNFLLIVNASRISEDFNWIDAQIKINNFNAELENKSEDYALIAVQGPFATDVISELGISKEQQPERFSISKANLISNEVLISRTGYTGEDGFEILIENFRASELWQELMEKGQKYGIKPIGLGARDTLRLEAAMHLYGQDLDENTTPVEAALGWSIPKNKEADYNGKEIILSQLANKDYDKVLIGFKTLDNSIPRHDYGIFNNGEKIGTVSSGGVAPFLGRNIGLGYISAKTSLPIGSKIDISIRGKFHPAEIVKRPFYVRKV